MPRRLQHRSRYRLLHVMRCRGPGTAMLSPCTASPFPAAGTRLTVTRRPVSLLHSNSRVVGSRIIIPLTEEALSTRYNAPTNRRVWRATVKHVKGKLDEINYTCSEDRFGKGSNSHETTVRRGMTLQNDKTRSTRDMSFSWLARFANLPSDGYHEEDVESCREACR